MGKTAKSMGRTRTIMFEWALQAATAENDKPIEFRLDWNHEEDSAVISGKPFGGGATAGAPGSGGGAKPRTSTGSSSAGGKKVSPGRGQNPGHGKNGASASTVAVNKKAKKEKARISSSSSSIISQTQSQSQQQPQGAKEISSDSANDNDNENGNGKGNGEITPSPVEVKSKSSPDSLLPTRRSIRERKPSKSRSASSTSPPTLPVLSTAIAIANARKRSRSLSCPSPPALSVLSATTATVVPVATTLDSPPTTPKRSNSSLKITIRTKQGSSNPIAIADTAVDVEFFCKICRNDAVTTSSNNDATAFDSSTNVGFVTLPSCKTSTFADARSIMVRELDEDCLPSNWKFYVPHLGPMSRKQEERYGPMLEFLRNATKSEQFGNGTRHQPLLVLIYECK